MISIGNDIVEIKRVKIAFEKHGSAFLQRVYSDAEIDYCMRQKNPFPSLAVRFAAKEATSKAFKVGIGGILSWKSMCVDNDKNGAPFLVLDDKASLLMKKFDATTALLSLSHTSELAQAFVVIK